MMATSSARSCVSYGPARLAEWKKQRGHYEGGTGIRGVSMKVPGTTSMRVYTGGLSQRRYVPGDEAWQFIEDGSAVITSKRLSSGVKRRRLNGRSRSSSASTRTSPAAFSCKYRSDRSLTSCSSRIWSCSASRSRQR
jgi:hypothetical protein